MDFKKFWEQKKEKLKSEHRFRQLHSDSGLDFCSNDYLGLSQNIHLSKRILKRLEGLPLGSTGSRLLKGQSEHVDKLEAELARFSKTESALFFPTGYQANLALFSGLLKSGAVVFSDELIHASIIDGIRLSGTEKYIWSHNDVRELDILLKQKARVDRLNVVVVESIYSMSGDFAPLVEISEVCRKHGAYLIVDEAHSTGLFGENGAGLVDHLNLGEFVLARTHTAGKALGVSGAWLACGSDLKELLVNEARPFIFSTAPAFYQQAALLEVIDWLKSEYLHLRFAFENKQRELQSFLLQLCEKHSLALKGLGGPVSALILGENEKALRVMEFMQSQGVDVRAVRPPTVPQGEAMLRITCPVSRSEKDIEHFKISLAKCLEDLV